jgi:putrescine aminotransferase
MNGSKSRTVQRYDRDHIFHPLTNPQEMLHRGSLMIERGEGIYLYDIDGKEYLDGMAGLWNVNIGYGRAELAAAAEDQMKRLSFAPLFWGRGNTPAAELAEKLSSLLPAPLSHFHFTSGGSESNESAFKIARYYWRLKGKPDKTAIVACSRAYHGVSMVALGATGLSHFVEPFGNRPAGYAHIPSPYCYHCPLDQQYPQCQIACARALQEYIEQTGADRIAAFVIEPVEGAGGVIIPPPEYLPMIHEICRENGILLIFDEVITGFGRTGSMFAVNRYDFQPDMISMAKGITSGYVPLGAVAVSDEIYQTLAGVDRIFFHGFTYS